MRNCQNLFFLRVKGQVIGLFELMSIFMWVCVDMLQSFSFLINSYAHKHTQTRTHYLSQIPFALVLSISFYLFITHMPKELLLSAKRH